MPSGQSENIGPIRESSLECMQGVVLYMKKPHFISRNISSVVYGSAPLKSIILSTEQMKFMMFFLYLYKISL